MRIFFTGGSGKAGRHVVPHLVSRGHRVLNADLVPLGVEGVDDLRVDLTDAGQVFSALRAPAGFDELEDPDGPPGYDAVVHFAAIPRIGLRPDTETFRINAVSTFNVLEAALKSGVRKVVFASSETTYGICFAQGERRPDYLPVDEEHPTIPEDAYAMSKVVNEATARSFQARTGADIYGLRINNVIEPHEYARDFPRYFEEPDLRRRNVFAYIDARDLGQIVERCLEADGLGFQIFNAANDAPSVDLTSEEIVARWYQGVPQRRPLERFESPYSNEKIRRVLGFSEEHPWWRATADPRGERG
jgi:nucleoside-diphosphate-sugar epimerase